MSAEPEIVTETTSTTTTTAYFSLEALAAAAGLTIEEGDSVQGLTGNVGVTEPWKSGHGVTAVRVVSTSNS